MHGPNYGRSSRPTHFIAIPLHTNPILNTKIRTFQEQLLQTNNMTTIHGLDRSIVIDPIRFHLTLGVMTLVQDSAPHGDTEERSARTVSSALALLRSLKPQVDAILIGGSDGSGSGDIGLDVLLDAVDIMPGAKRATGKDMEGRAQSSSQRDELWANVMYLAPRETGDAGVKLRRIADLVHSKFKQEGYITETRPLKLHCTILNSSKRRPAHKRGPFSYSDILTANVLRPLLSAPSSSTTSTGMPSQTRFRNRSRANATRVSIDLPDTVRVRELALWVMGSRARDGAYVTVGDRKSVV